MSDTLRLTITSAFGIILLYWLFVVTVRSAFGIELFDPADFLPHEWRNLVPRRL
jgi:hypothetical protein